MGGPVDKITSDAVDGQTDSNKGMLPRDVPDDINKWKHVTVRFSLDSKNTGAIVATHTLMYIVLALAGFSDKTGFNLDPAILVTLVAATIGVSVPHYFKLFIGVRQNHKQS